MTTQDSKMKLIGVSVGDWTCLQACYRPLQKGEVRSAVCSRVARGVPRRKWHGISDAVIKLITEMSS